MSALDTPLVNRPAVEQLEAPPLSLGRMTWLRFRRHKMAIFGGIVLILMRIITPVIPLAVLGALFAWAALARLIDPAHFPPATLHLSSGAAMMAAFFIATDYVTSPTTPMGRAIYGVGIGTLIFVIRSWGAFPEGVAFSVLLMNACTPLIDTYVRPRIFGRTRSGKPLEIGERR